MERRKRPKAVILIFRGLSTSISVLQIRRGSLRHSGVAFRSGGADARERAGTKVGRLEAIGVYRIEETLVCLF